MTDDDQKNTNNEEVAEETRQEEPKSEAEIADKGSEEGDSEEGSRRVAAATEESEDARRETELAGPPSEESEPTTDEAEESVSAGDSSATPQNDISSGPGKWYVVHTYSGHENKVAAALKQRVEAEHLEDKIIDVLVPTQNKIEIKGGKKYDVKEKIFPGYILVRMVLDDNSWLAVRTIPGVTSFVGMGNKPTVIPDSEVQTIINYSKIEQPSFKQVFEVSDTVKIVDGPFAEMIGKIDSLDQEKGKVRVLVSIFGRETPVELDFLQVQKI